MLKGSMTSHRLNRNPDLSPTMSLAISVLAAGHRPRLPLTTAHFGRRRHLVVVGYVFQRIGFCDGDGVERVLLRAVNMRKVAPHVARQTDGQRKLVRPCQRTCT